MIEICCSSGGDVDLAGTPEELGAIADTIREMAGSDAESIAFDAATGFDPTPYDRSIPLLRVVKNTGLAKVSFTDEELLVEGSPDSLAGFTAYLRFAPNARPSNHARFAHWPGNEQIAPDSIPLTIGIRQQR